MKLNDVLDVQLIDCDGRRCGKVDAVDYEDGEPAVIRCGPAVWRERVPRWMRWLLPDSDACVRVPWSEVDHLGPHVHLRSRAQDLGLGHGDDELRYLLGRLPWRDAQ